MNVNETFKKVEQSANQLNQVLSEFKLTFKEHNVIGQLLNNLGNSISQCKEAFQCGSKFPSKTAPPASVKGPDFKSENAKKLLEK